MTDAGMTEGTPYVISPSADVLASDVPPPGRHWGRWAAIGGAGVAVVALAAGGFAAYGALSGGGTQPETFVPANAVAYVELDLNPPASQKLNTVRLLHKLPKDTLKSTSNDYRQLLLSTAFSKSSDVDYAKDVDPWLGDRVAVAVLPAVAGGDSPTVEAVLQVKDEAAFKAAAPKLFKDGDGGYVLRDGYAIVAQDTDVATRVSESAAKADLADDKDYSLDTSNLGDRVVTGWYDLSRAASLVPASASSALSGSALTGNLQGRATFAVHVESDAVELVARQTGSTAAAGSPAKLLSKLPNSTVAAVEVTDLGTRIAAQWSQTLKALAATSQISPDQLIAMYEKQFGLKLPDDLSTALGTDAVVAVMMPSGSTQPAFGYLAVTDPARAKPVAAHLGKLLSQLGVPAPSVTATGLAWGTSPSWVQDSSSGSLGASAKVKAALPDLDSANAAIYLDLSALAHLSALDNVGGGAVSSAENAGLESFGMTSTANGSTSTLRLRITVK